MKSTNSRISRISVGRLYNLGNYEHVRYELTIEVPEGATASETMEGVERLMAALNPREPGSVPSESTIQQDERRLTDMKERFSVSSAEFERYYDPGYVGTPEEYIARCEQSLLESIRKRQAWKAKSKKARALLDDLGGAACWRDAKLEWDDDGEM